MVVKIPITSFAHYLDMHFEFAVNSIRKANHPEADDIISYLYELLNIQQKIAISLHEYLRLTHYPQLKKR